jgi:UDP-2,4-diacetamido-2,4,6-trideoxy-beta-L-altropyranose hydrolase
MSKLTILTEAGRNIGFGHYSRCKAILENLIPYDIKKEFLVNCIEDKLFDSEIKNIDWINKIESINPTEKNHVMLIDSYLADEKIYSLLKSRFKKVIAIDDYNRIIYDVNLIINPNVCYKNIDYSNQKTKIKGGKRYVILRKEFREISNKIINKEPNKILITLGGSDYRNLLQLIVNLSHDFPELQWTIINPENKKLERLMPKTILLKTIDSKSMASLMLDSDIVISGCGQTLNELVSIGTPTIGICIDDDQVCNQNFYFENDFINHKNFWNESDLKTKLKIQINELLKYENRKEIFKNTRDLINKNGVINLIKDII